MMMRQANKVKRTEINLNYLRNDLDLWLHRVASWIDNKKTNPLQDDIKTLGIEMVQKLCIRKVLKKKDIDDMKFPGLHLTPNRSSSASPNRHTTPDSASRRSKSITRLSPEDQHSDCQKKLDFNNDEDGYKVDADINPATCTCAHDETFYKCGISLLEKQKIKLEKELQRLAGERNDHAKKLQKIEFENAKLAEKYKNLETHILTTEQDETLCLKTRSYEYTIQNQKKLILEFQKREEEQKIALKNANDALEQHIHMLEICREEKNEAESILSDYLIKNDSVKLHCEIAQLQKNLKKQKQTADEQIHNFKKYLKEKENDLQQGTKRFNEMNEKLKEMERQGKYISFRNEKELLQEQKNNRILVKDNESLREKIFEIENNHAEERKQQIDIQSKFKHEVSNLKVQNSIADKKVTNVEKDLEEMTSKCKEEQSVFNSKRCQLEREIKELRLQLDEMRKSTEYRCYSAVEGRSDTEKEHISLRSELTEALKNIEKIRQEYTDLSKRYETGKIATKRTIESPQQEKDCLEQEKVNLRAKLYQIQSDLNLFKNEQVPQQDSSHGTIENLLQQNRKLDNDRELLRGKIFSLENDKIKLEDILNKIKEDNKKLQSDHGKLQDNIREKSNEIKDSEVRLGKLEADILFFQNTKTENEQLKESLHELEGVKREFDNLEQRYIKEASDRMSSDDISTKYKEDNDRLRKERNSARIDLQRVLRQNKESYQNLNTEHVLAREELQNKEREKSELVALFKDKENKDLQKIQLYEKEIETLKSSCRDDNDQMRQSKHEIETFKSWRKDDNHKIQHLEHEIESLKSRLTGEKANQYSAYEVLQNKNNLETCKHQKKALEDERNELQKENIELENELQSLKAKLEQFEDSARDISNLKKRIKDREEGYRNVISNFHEVKRKIQELNETIDDQNQENRGLIEKLEKLDEEKKDLENKLSNKETSNLQKENVELKHNLQNLSKQLKESENRLQELEVLRRQVHKLDFENSELNKRLEINKKEKSSIHKENKELKNILQEKLSEVKRLEKRLQQYAEKFEDIPAQKRHMDKLQSDNDELNLKCKHLQTVEKDVQKLKKEKQQLETEIISQRQNNETLNSRLEILSVEKLEIEDRLRRRSPQVVTDPRNCQNCWKYRNDISDLKREINDLRDRLSEAAGNKLRDNNPNIADLSDMNRPTSLAEKFSSLYTDEYTDAMEVIEDDMDEAASVKVMLQWLQSCYEWCQKLAKEQRDTLINKSIGFMQDYGGQNVVLSDRCLIFVKEFQKKIAVESLVVVGQICHVKSVTQQTLSSDNYIVKYIKKCSELCWMMQISDPPLYLNFGVKSGEDLNKNDYNVFTKSGSKIDYLVWPVLYLHKTGPMLAKGVAQGK